MKRTIAWVIVTAICLTIAAITLGLPLLMAWSAGPIAFALMLTIEVGGAAWLWAMSVLDNEETI